MEQLKWEVYKIPKMKRIDLRVTEAEKKLIQDMADECGLSLSSFILKSVLGDLYLI